MERRKQYNEKQVEQDLYQYEMGIELGADVEAEKEIIRANTIKSILLRISKTATTTTRATPRETTRISVTRTTRISIVKDMLKKTLLFRLENRSVFL